MSNYTVRVERWATRKGKVTKFVIRSRDGRLHGATNFRGTVISR